MKRFIILIGFMATMFAFGQQDPMFTHYMYNTLSVNPAYAGSREALTVTLLHRNQWVSFPGAPKTNTMTLHSPVFNENVGLGLSLTHDVIGPTKFTSMYGDFAFRVKLTKKSNLTFGLKAGVDLLTANLPFLQIQDPNDPAFLNSFKNKALPNFGFGLFYTYKNRFYAGLSIPRMLQHKFVGENTLISSGILKGHYYFITGASLKLSNFVEFKPSALVKMTVGAPVELDVTALFELYKRINFGVMYRTGDAFGALVGVYIFDRLLLGYSYDFSLTNTTLKYNGGSHEIMLRYDFIFSSSHRIKSPRYF
jgi:type IX secretion system PorP/SprF family membrane protein